MDSPAPHLLLLLAALLTPSPAAAAALGVIRLPSGKTGARACAAPPDPAAYDRPVIGIVTHPGDGAGGRISNGTATSYIGASYVKFVEAAGARVIPLVYNEPEERLLEKLSLVNGVLFTGGSEKQGVYFETIKKVFQDNNILETFDALNQASTLQFPSYSFEGTVFQRFDPDLIKKVSTSCLVMQNHRPFALLLHWAIIHPDCPLPVFLQKLGLVNGVLFTGGSQKNGSYFETIKNVFQVHSEHRFKLIGRCICKKCPSHLL
ncbi:Gamma-glutamyl hydrolase 1 [Dichanthelium oligosanthes]|uniref:folate gamma-glutamyl hydrolase n=1 Tax=Dichanthelium oligosanthes TaxID=888268 RepID=A0A1E5UK58_9POAL|nr:Gamma-glutamyl hydrolase 1 [Dichanthelium oligosanthes]